MKEVVWFVVILFLISFTTAIPITSSVVENGSGQNYGNNQNENSNGEQVQTNTMTANQENETELQNRIRERIQSKLTNEQIKKIFTIRNRIRNQYQNQSECPNNCTCTGSTTKCSLTRTREMTITAGKSGNIIIQVKGINASTNVTLYKSDDGKLYVVKRNNETKIVKMFPDQVRERVRERVERRFENENISLDDDGVYRYRAEKRARLFGIFPVRERFTAEVDPETGELIRTRTSWWGFLAADEKAEVVLGGSCGTVTPGENDACCQNRGYDKWNSQIAECEFSE